MGLARALAPALAALALSGCADGRSVEAFCTTLDSETRRLGEKYQAEADYVEARAGGVEGLFIAAGTALEAQGDIVALFDRLTDVAPSEIQADVEAVHGVLEEQVEAIRSGDFIAMLSSSTLGALQVSGSAERVDEFILTNC